MVAPIDKEFDNIVRNRAPKDYKYNRHEFFSQSTKSQISKLFRLILDMEVTCEKWRKDLAAKSRFYPRDVFDKIDIMKKNYIIREDVIYLSF